MTVTGSSMSSARCSSKTSRTPLVRSSTPAARRRTILAPGPRLPVRVGLVRPPARRREGLAYESNDALDPTLLVAAGDRYGSRLEAVVPREREDRRMESDRVSPAFEDRALEVVVEEHPRDTAKPLERQHVPAQKHSIGAPRKKRRKMDLLHFLWVPRAPRGTHKRCRRAGSR